MAGTAENPAVNEMYCPTCGEIIRKEAEICPECGVKNEAQKSEQDPGEDSRIGKKGYIGIGITFGLVSLVVVPIIFGPISMFSGYQLYKMWSERWGIGMIAFGGVCMVMGMIIGAISAVA